MLRVQGEKSAARYLFRKGLEVNHRSRYVHLSWGLFARDNGQVENARELFRRGHALNPEDAAILQVQSAMPSSHRRPASCMRWHPSRIHSAGLRRAARSL